MEDITEKNKPGRYQFRGDFVRVPKQEQSNPRYQNEQDKIEVELGRTRPRGDTMEGCRRFGLDLWVVASVVVFYGANEGKNTRIPATPHGVSHVASWY
eukprot:scaffold24072_cov125-Amphora_coffeaeformis.AAC.2